MQTILYRELLDNLYDGVYFVDTNRTITYWNRAAEHITGYSCDEVMGKGCFDNILVHVDEKGHPLCESSCPILAAMKDGDSREVNTFLKHRDGHRIPVLIKVNAIRDTDGNIVGSIQSFNDNSSLLHIKQHAADLEKLSTYDGLTGVGNRRFADVTLQKKLAELKRYGSAFGALFADIDNLKLVNDTYGHEAGDEVLKMVARTILSNIRPFDFIFRWGGDEFMLVLVNVDQRRLLTTSERVRAAVQNAALRYGSDTIKVTVSIGGTIAQPEDMDKSILARTDDFMYRCKQEGRNRCLVDDLTIPQTAQPTTHTSTAGPAPQPATPVNVVTPQIVHIPALFGRVDIHAPVSIAIVYRQGANGASQQAAGGGASAHSDENPPVFDLIIYPSQYTTPHLNPRQHKDSNSNHAHKTSEGI